MKAAAHLVLVMVLLAAPAAAGDWKSRTWKVSLAVLATASAADAASSWNRNELNPALRGANGQFGAQAVSIKVGVAMGVLLGQQFALRRIGRANSPQGAGAAYKAFTVTNFAMAATYAGVAAHNYSQR